MDYLTRQKLLKILAVVLVIVILLVAIGLALYISLSGSLEPLERAKKILASAPLVDGYNGFAYSVRLLAKNDLGSFNFSRNLTQVSHWSASMTDIPRLRAGKVGAQIWSAQSECASQHKDAVVITLEQIDVLKRMIANYSDDLKLVTTADDISKTAEEGKIGSLISVDGGHSIQYSLAVLRTYYELGVRSMSLTTHCSNPWAQSYSVESFNKTLKLGSHHGLSSFGEDVIREMNRLGMMIDVSHSSVATMKDVLWTSKAPVIFSRSAAKTVCGVDLNIPDDVLRLVRMKEGLVMVNFFPDYIKCGANGKVTIEDVIKHLEHVRSRTTVDCVGIGSSFDDIDRKIEGLEDVSKFPNLFAALVETGRWSDEDLRKLAGRNFIRVLRAVEEVKEDLKETMPIPTWIKRRELKLYTNLSCSGTSLMND